MTSRRRRRPGSVVIIVVVLLFILRAASRVVVDFDQISTRRRPRRPAGRMNARRLFKAIFIFNSLQIIYLFYKSKNTKKFAYRQHFRSLPPHISIVDWFQLLSVR
jgi:hypothetical protein